MTYIAICVAIFAVTLWWIVSEDARWWRKHYYLDWTNHTKHRLRYERAVGLDREKPD